MGKILHDILLTNHLSDLVTQQLKLQGASVLYYYRKKKKKKKTYKGLSPVLDKNQ